jgi:DNA-binding MarR family transcriptional regulator
VLCRTSIRRSPNTEVQKAMAVSAKKPKKKTRQSLLLAEYPLYYMTHVVEESREKIQEAIRSLKITSPQWRVLFVLHDHEELTISEISFESRIEASTLSRLLKSLEKRKLISRIRDNEDQRYTKIRLTAEGHKVFQSIEPVVTRQLEFIFTGMSDADRRTLLRILKTLKENVYRSPFSVV